MLIDTYEENETNTQYMFSTKAFISNDTVICLCLVFVMSPSYYISWSGLHHQAYIFGLSG